MSIVASAALLAALLPVPAQAQAWRCLTVGPSHDERLERDDHTLRVTTYTCRVRGGLLDGFVATATNVWEFQHGVGRLLVATGVMRRPGAVVVFQGEGSQHTIVSHGAAMGWQSSGTGVYKLATGSAAPLMGRSFSFAAQPQGGSLFTIETALRD